MFSKENVTRAEIRWALKTVICSYEVTNALFREMFPDCKIGLSFSFQEQNTIIF